MSTGSGGTESPNASDENWREPLLASLRDCGVQRAPRHPILGYFLAIFVMLFTVSVAGLGGRIIGEATAHAPPPVRMGALALFGILFVIPVLTRLRNRALRRAWQSSARSAEDELMRAGTRRPILYLRSFKLDSRIERPSWAERYLGTRPMGTVEQKLTNDLKKYGPVIAIGRPDERLPALGAARFYVSHERWQEKVADVLKASQLVVWATGVTEGLKWEISHLTENMQPEKVLLWAHPHLLGVSAAKREAEWKRFIETLGSVFPKPLPATLGPARFIVFDKDWTPHAIAPSMQAVFTSAQTSALRAALESKAGRLGGPGLPAIAGSTDATDFGTLIGARGQTLNWPLIAVFFAALVLLGIPTFIYDKLSYEYVSLTNRLITAGVQTLCAVAAFRFIRNSALAALAAAAAAALALYLYHGKSSLGGFDSPAHEFMLRLVLPFLENLALFAGLAWALRHVSPLFLALCSGALIGIAAQYLRIPFGHYIAPVRYVLLPLNALAFAVSYALLLKFVPVGGDRAE